MKKGKQQQQQRKNGQDIAGFELSELNELIDRHNAPKVTMRLDDYNERLRRQRDLGYTSALLDLGRIVRGEVKKVTELWDPATPFQQQLFSVLAPSRETVSPEVPS